MAKVPLTSLIDLYESMLGISLDALTRVAVIARTQKNKAISDVVIEINSKLQDTRKSFLDFVEDFNDGKSNE